LRWCHPGDRTTDAHSAGDQNGAEEGRTGRNVLSSVKFLRLGAAGTSLVYPTWSKNSDANRLVLGWRSLAAQTDSIGWTKQARHSSRSRHISDCVVVSIAGESFRVAFGTRWVEGEGGEWIPARACDWVANPPRIPGPSLPTVGDLRGRRPDHDDHLPYSNSRFSFFFTRRQPRPWPERRIFDGSSTSVYRTQTRSCWSSPCESVGLQPSPSTPKFSAPLSQFLCLTGWSSTTLR
jgi:hypothetical protein